jgi:hypothetical protein
VGLRLPLAAGVMALVGFTGAFATHAPAAQPVEPPEVETLDAGDAPRAELRYTVPAGTTQTVKVRTYSRFSQRVGDRAGSARSPDVIFTIDATVAEVGADGNLLVDYVYSDVTVPDDGSDAVEATRDALQPLEGATGSIVVTPTGSVVSSDLTVPPDLDATAADLVDQLSSQASQLAVPLPNEPVGVGARWRAATDVELNGVRFTQRTDYAFDRRKGERIVLAVEVRQRAPRQRFTPPGASQEILLLSSRATGSGTNVLDLATAPLPVGGHTVVEVRQRLRAEGQRIAQTTRTNVLIRQPS